MSAPILLVDAGNTHILAAIHDGTGIVDREQVPTDGGDFAGAVTRLVTGVPVHGAALATVSPAGPEPLLSVLRSVGGIEDPLVVDCSVRLNFEMMHPEPGQVGADRLANVAAACDGITGAAIVVDMGTAMTFDLVSRDRKFLGGIIAPGPATAARALFENAPLLPEVGWDPPRRAVPIDTEDALRAGVVQGSVAQVDGLVAHLAAQLGEDVTVVATGGLASIVAPHAHTVDRVEPQWTLAGLRVLWRLNRP